MGRDDIVDWEGFDSLYYREETVLWGMMKMII